MERLRPGGRQRAQKVFVCMHVCVCVYVVDIIGANQSQLIQTESIVVSKNRLNTNCWMESYDQSIMGGVVYGC